MLGREGIAHAKVWRYETCSWNPEPVSAGVKDMKLDRQAGADSSEPTTHAPCPLPADQVALPTA